MRGVRQQNLGASSAQKGRGGGFREFVGRGRGRGRVADDRLRQEGGKRKEG